MAFDIMTIFGLASEALRLYPTVRNIIGQGLSLNTLSTVVENTPLLDFFKHLGAAVLPDVSPDLQASAAIAVHYDTNYVMKVQNAANELLGAGLEVDGKYGPKTQAAVKQLQQKLGLQVIDGWAGDNTMAAITKALAERKPQAQATPMAPAIASAST